jgi:hypothetical protein
MSDSQTAAEASAALANIEAPAAQPERPPRVTVEQLRDLPESEHKTGWINALVDAELARLNYAQDRQLGRDFAACGQFDDLKNMSPSQAIATAITKQQIGRMWGLKAADSIKSVVFINGRPSLENDVVAARLAEAGWAWDIEWIEAEGQHKGKPVKQCIGCRLWPKRWSRDEGKYLPLTDRQGQAVSVEFTEADAERAQIWEKGKQIPLTQKWNFQSWARDMYYWKCISRLKKFYAPNVMRGGAVMREEATEMVPVEQMPPELLPPELQPPGAPPEGKRQRLRDRLMGQGNAVDVSTESQQEEEQQRNLEGMK